MRLAKLYFDFLKFGAFIFGGGWSIVAQMQELYVKREKSITEEELLDITSIGRSLPGDDREYSNAFRPSHVGLLG
ncbi:MAG: chromate transporter, partial [Synergistaceae bacterium]|nr:chromate transporter [Synergistaceae bacterium]